MEFRILGPLEMWDEGAGVSLGGAPSRLPCSPCSSSPNEVVPADRLIDELWGESSPEDAAAALRVNVSRLLWDEHLGAHYVFRRGGSPVGGHPLFLQGKPEQPKCRTARWPFSLPPATRTCPISPARTPRQT